MSRFHAPEDSVTEQSVRMAFNYEYMVPVQVAWGLEQALDRALAECDRLRAVERSQEKAFDHLAQDLRGVTQALNKAREECHQLRLDRRAADRAFHELHKAMMGGEK
jgi:hypothetical protein